MVDINNNVAITFTILTLCMLLVAKMTLSVYPIISKWIIERNTNNFISDLQKTSNNGGGIVYMSNPIDTKGIVIPENIKIVRTYKIKYGKIVNIRDFEEKAAAVLNDEKS